MKKRTIAEMDFSCMMGDAEQIIFILVVYVDNNINE